MEPVFLILVTVGIIVGLFLFFYIIPLNLWITAVFSGVNISISQLIFMRIRKVPPALVVNALINSTKAGLRVTSNDIETHYLAGGNVNAVIRAMISA
ncbi:MAG: flotillin-like FloA family protein, partial [Bacteroidota bacterium]